MFVKKLTENYLIGIHYGVVTFIKAKDYIGNESGDTITPDDINGMNFFDCKTLKSLLRFYDKYKDCEAKRSHNLTLDKLYFNICITEDGMVINVEDDVVTLDSELINGICADMSSSNSIINKTESVISQMRTKTASIIEQYPDLAEIPIEVILAYADSGRLEEIVKQCATV